MPRSATFASLLTMVTSLLSACGSPPPPENPAAPGQPIPHGLILTEGVQIADSHGRFTLGSGPPFVPPFYLREPFFVDGEPAVLSQRAIQLAVAGGAASVRVTVAKLDKPLHGLLWLGVVQQGVEGAVSRAYHISIPDEYVTGALGGKITAVWEPYEWIGAARPTRGVDGHWQLGARAKRTAASWVLWLSDLPLPGTTAAPIGGALPGASPATTGGGCTRDVDCAGDAVCESGRCTTPGPVLACGKDTDCPGELVCSGGRCAAK